MRYSFALLALLVLAGCGSHQTRTIEMVPIGTAAPGLNEDAGSTTAAIVPEAVGAPGTKSGCNLGDTDDVLDWITNEKCRVPNNDIEPRSGLREKLEWKLVASTPQITAGGRVDLSLALKNRSSEMVPLYFLVDGPVFVVQAFDAKGKRVDLPAGKPKAPQGVIVEEGPPKVARLNVTAGATLKARLVWDAVKTRWAPDKIEGSFVTQATFPRAPAGNLALGMYSIRVVPQMSAVAEDVVPKLPIEVIQ